MNRRRFLSALSTLSGAGVASTGLDVFGQNAAARTPDVIFVPTDFQVVIAMLKLAEVSSKDIVYDLGCGDGRFVVTAARQFGARGVGVDIDPDRIQEARALANRTKANDKVRFIQGDLFETDISEATVVTLYLLTRLNLKLRPKLLKELKPGTRIVSHAFDMGDWQPEKTVEVAGTFIYLWRVPRV
jgi:ubiquinone/menaquinone biosynthesis C-methylase UbiE